jgi:hypothetical protein
MSKLIPPFILSVRSSPRIEQGILINENQKQRLNLVAFEIETMVLMSKANADFKTTCPGTKHQHNQNVRKHWVN